MGSLGGLGKAKVGFWIYAASDSKICLYWLLSILNGDQIETRRHIFLGALGVLSEAGGSKEFLTAKTQRAPRNAIVL
jgi:hypothetical protein